jgi:uncharacterized protein (TIGR03086 family)
VTDRTLADAVARYVRVSGAFGARVNGVRDWSMSTPCSEWTALDLLAHVVNTHHRVLATCEGREPEEVDGTDAVTAWPTVRARVIGAAVDPLLASSEVSTPFGSMPFAVLCGSLLCADTLIHTWDLARATGQDERLDAGDAAAVHAMLEPLDEGMRLPGGFAAKLEPPPGADAQARLLAFCGRKP